MSIELQQAREIIRDLLATWPESSCPPVPLCVLAENQVNLISSIQEPRFAWIAEDDLDDELQEAIDWHDHQAQLGEGAEMPEVAAHHDHQMACLREIRASLGVKLAQWSTVEIAEEAGQIARIEALAHGST